MMTRQFQSTRERLKKKYHGAERKKTDEKQTMNRSTNRQENALRKKITKLKGRRPTKSKQ